MNRAPAAQAPVPVARAERRALLAILVLALALRLVGFTDPWSGKGFKTAFGTFTTGAHARVFYEHGFLETRLMPAFWRLELADGTVLHEYYTHHPAAVAVLSGLSMRLFGPEPWAVSLPWLCFSLLSIAIVWRLAREVWGPGVARLAALFLAVVPLSAWYGTLAWVDGAVLCCAGMLVLAWIDWLRGGGTRALARAAAWAFAGALFDWSALFFLPGLGLQALFATRGQWRRLLPCLMVPAGALAAVALHRLHMQLVLDPEELARETGGTLAWTTTLQVPLGRFLELQWDHVRRLLTIPFAALVLGGSLLEARRLVRGEASSERWLLFPLLLPGLLYVALFPARSANHDMFLFVSLAGFAIAAALAWSELALGTSRRAWGTARRAGALRALGPVALAVVCGWCGWRVVRIWANHRSDALQRLVRSEWLAPLLADERAVILTNSGAGMALPFHARAPVITGIDAPERLDELRHEALGRLGPGRRVVFLLDLARPGASPDLARALAGLVRPERHAELASADPPLAFDLFDLSAWAAE